MKGVMMLVNDFPPLPTGGAERQAERLATYMASHDVTTGVLTRKVGKLPSYEKRDGFDVYRLRQIGLGKMKTLTFTLATMFALLTRKASYDILHAHLAFSPAIAAAVIGKIVGKRVIVKFGNSAAFGDVQRSKKTLRGRLRMTILRRWADVIIALDPQMEAEVLGDGFAHERVLCMDNGIDASDFVPCVDKDSAKRRLNLEIKTTALFTGRLTNQKALPVLLQALQQVAKTYSDVQLIILGHGEEKETLMTLANELDIAEQVIFHSPVNDVSPYLDAADIFVLPSLAEGISNSLLEAMSAGLACIATSVGGSPTVLDYGKCGILVSPGNVDQLSDALIELCTSSNIRDQLGARARKRILDRYNFDVVGQKYYALYEQLLETQ